MLYTNRMALRDSHSYFQHNFGGVQRFNDRHKAYLVEVVVIATVIAALVRKALSSLQISERHEMTSLIPNDFVYAQARRRKRNRPFYSQNRIPPTAKNKQVIKCHPTHSTCTTQTTTNFTHQDHVRRIHLRCLQGRHCPMCRHGHDGRVPSLHRH